VPRIGRVASIAGIGTIATLAAVVLAVAVRSASGGPPVEVVTRSGFGPPDDRRDGRTRWLEGDLARLEVAVRERPRRVLLEMELSSFARPRRVAVTLAGRTVARGNVPPATFATLRADLGRLAVGRHEVGLRASPAAQSIAATVGVADPRIVSVRLRALTATEVTAP
jgi:hypothetical protein